MVKPLLVALLLLCSLTSLAQQPLTNSDVINLVKAGFSSEVVTIKIKQSGGHFDTSPTALKQLKEAGVAESTIVAMIEASAVQIRPNDKSTQEAETATATLKEGTRVELELAYTVSSADLKEGDAVSFLTVQAIHVNGVIVIDRGSPGTARVVKAEAGKSWGRGGNLTWAIQHVTAVDGQKVPLHFTSGSKGDGKPGTVTTGIVVTGLLFWPAAPFWGFKKGKPAVIPAGKRFEVFVHNDITINARQSAQQVPLRPSAQQPASSGKCYSNGRKVPCP